ncbi:MAG TPA: cytochrome c biogenesis protein CcsA [Vicinamibacteria bacterium]|nr:cytochrome c biogenesis protein CcsA [Vicinamibacteria bacterium]
MSSRVYLLLTLAFYAVGALSVLLHTLARRRLLTPWTVTAALAGFVMHTASLSQRWTEAGHFPVVGFHDGASFLAWATVLAFLATYVQTRVDALGLAVYPTAFVLVLLAALTPVSDREDPVLRSLYLPIHTTLALIGYGALFVAFAMGVMYLIQERELRARAPRAFYYLAPSLERCDTLGGHSVEVGFVFLTLAILTGLMWNLSRGAIWTGTPKEWSALAAWVIYVAMLVARRRSGWGGRRAALLGIAGFVIVVFTFFSLSLARGMGGAA